MSVLLQRLPQWPAPEAAPAGLTRRLVARAAESEPARRRPQRYAIAATPLVGFPGGLLIWHALDTLTGGTEPVTAEEPAAQVSLALMQTESVRVAITAKRPVNNALMTVELPPGVEIAGYPGQRRLQWHTDLTAGRNQLTLPLTARRAVSGGMVKARVEYEGRHKQLAIRVDADDEQATRPAGSPDSTTLAMLTAPVRHPQTQPERIIRSARRYSV
jgi:hypothetical protein